MLIRFTTFEFKKWGSKTLGIIFSAVLLSSCGKLNLTIPEITSDDGSSSQKPTVSFTLPATNSYLGASGITLVNVTGTCSEEGRPVVITGAISSSPVCTNHLFSVTLDFSAVAEGGVNLFADHSNAENVAAVQATRSVIKDTQAPNAVSFVNPSGNIILGATTYGFSWTTTDNGMSGLKQSGAYTVKRFANATCAPAEMDTTAMTPSNFSFGSMVDGTTYSLQVSATDEAGNTSAAVCSGSVTVNMAAATLSLSDPTTNSQSYARQPNVNVAIANDAGATKWCVSEIQTTKPATGLAACTGGQGATSGWHTVRPTTFDLSGGDGAKTVYVWTADILDNVGTIAVNDAIILDTQLPVNPTVAVTDPSSGSATTTNESPANLAITVDTGAVRWCVIDLAGAAAAPAQPVYNDACFVTPRPTTVAMGAQGQRKVYVFTKDLAENISASYGMATIIYDNVVPNNPVGWTLSSPNTGTTSNDNTPIVSGTGIVGEDGSSGIVFNDALCATPVGNATIAGGNVTVNNITYLTNGTQDGVKNFYGVVADASGNLSACTDLSLSYTLDTTVPNQPTLALFNPGTSPGNDPTPEIRIGNVLAGDTVYLHTDSSCLAPSLRGSTGVAIPPVEIISSNLGADGTYVFYAKVTDPGGNSICSTASVSYVLESIPPTTYLWAQVPSTSELPTASGGWFDTTGLVGYWKFNETNADQGEVLVDSVTGGVGNAVLQTGADGAGVNKDRVGKLNGALDFDGVDDYASCSANAGFDNPAQHTFMAWVKPDSGTAYHYVLTTGNVQGRVLGLYTQGGLMYPSASIDMLTTDAQSYPVFIVGNSAPIGKWSHIAVTWAGVGQPLRLYLNGSEVTYSVQSAGSGGLDSESGLPCSIGRANASGGMGYFDGKIDEVSRWNRALSGAEIARLYDIQSGKYRTTSPVNIFAEFGESVTGFTAGDLVCSSCTASNVAAGPANYTADVSFLAQGVATVDVPASSAQDAAGNNNAASNTLTFTFDSAAPVMVGTVVDGIYSISLTQTTNLTWSAATDVGGSGIDYYELALGTISGGTQVLSWINIGNVTSYQYSPLTLTSGVTYYPSVRAVDLAGNTSNVINGDGWVADNVAPTVTINQGGSQADPTTATPIVFDVVFSESVNGFIAGDVTMGGTATGVTFNVSGSGASYNVNVTAVTGAGTLVPTINSGAAQDGAGNNSLASTSTDNSVTYNVSIGAFTIAGVTGGTDSTQDAWLNNGVNPVINWQNTTGETSYDVTVYEYDGTTVKCATQNVAVDTTSYNFSGCSLTVSTSYKAKVVAKNGGTTQAATNDMYIFTVSPLSSTGTLTITDTEDDGDIQGASATTGNYYSNNYGDFTAGELVSPFREYAYTRFTLPQGIPSSIIQTATLSLYAVGSTSWSAASDALRVSFQNSPDPSHVDSANDYPGDSGGTVLTSANVRWPSSGGLTWTTGNWYNSPNLSAPLQEVINSNGGLAINSHVQVWFAIDATQGIAQGVSSEDYTALAGHHATLSISYTQIAPSLFTIRGVSGGVDLNPDDVLTAGVNPIISWNNTLGESSFDVTVFEDDGTTVKCATQTVAADVLSYNFSGCNLTTSTYYKARVLARDAGGSVTTASNSLFRFFVGNLLSPVYAINGANWNHYVKNNNGGTNVYNQPDIPCDGPGFSTNLPNCIHGGEKFKFATTLTSCATVTASDALGAFDWICDASGGNAVVYSKGLKTEKGLKDLVNATNWKNNQLTVMDGVVQIFQSPNSAWWGNPVVALPDNSAGAVIDLDDIDDDGAGPDQVYQVGTVFTLSSSRASGGYYLDLDRLSIVTLGSSVLTYNGNAVSNCNGGDQCLLISNFKHAWIEGSYDANAASGSDADFGLRLNYSRNSRINNFTLTNAINSAVVLADALGLHVTGATIANAGGNGAFNCDYGMSYSLFERLTITNSNKGIWLYDSCSNNVFDQVTATNNADWGVSVRLGSNNNTFRNIKLSYSGGSYPLLGIDDSNDNKIFDSVFSANEFAGGILIDGSSTGTVINRVQVSNVGFEGIELTAGTSGTVISQAILQSNGYNGIEINGSDNNVISNITFASNDVGLQFYTTANQNTVHNILGGANNYGIGFGGIASNNNTLSQVAIVNSFNSGIELASSSNNSKFTGNIIVGNNVTGNCVVSGGTNPGLVNSTCTTSGADGSSAYTGGFLSDALLRTNRSSATTFLGKVYNGDSVNTSDSATGAADYPTVPATFDFTGFENLYRGWGPDFGPYPYWQNGGRWSLGDRGSIYDWRLRSTDTAILNKTGDGAASNGAFSVGGACPAAANGTVFATDQAARTYLLNAVEIIDPLSVGYSTTGNHNGLCESNEACAYTPNFGAYQGSGAFGTCTFTGGTVTGVAMYGYGTNGEPYNPPSPPANPTLALSDTSSTSSTHSNATSITVSVEADPLAVKWCLSETQTTKPANGGAACSGGAWETARPTTFTLSAGSGNKTVYVWVADTLDAVNAGTVSDVIVLDTVIPNLAGSVTLPATYFSTTSTPNLSWPTATDGETSIVDYELEIRETTACSSGTIILNWTSLALVTSHQQTGLTLTNGTSYCARIRAEDSAENKSAIITGTWTVDTVPPNQPSALTLQSPATSPNNDSTPTIRVSGVLTSDVVELHTDDALCLAPSLRGSGTSAGTFIDITSNSLADGAYTFYAKVTDPSGNSICSTATVAYTLDTVLPAAPTGWTMSSPNTGTTSNDNTPQFANAGAVADALNGVAWVYRDSGCVTNIGSGTINGAGNFTATNITLANDGSQDGLNTFYGRITDQAGNASTGCTALSLSYTLDTVGPTVTVNQKAGQADPTATLPILFTVTFSENVTGLTATDFLFAGGAAISAKSLSGSGASYELSVDTVSSDGTVIPYLAAGVAFDSNSNGNQASTSTDSRVTYSNSNILRGFNGPVKKLLPLADGRTLVGGLFTGYGPHRAPHIVRLDADGSADTTFSSILSGFDGPVYSVIVERDASGNATGRYIAGGYFFTYNGTDARYLARINSDGSLDTTWTGVGAGGVVDFLYPELATTGLPTGKIFVSGDFNDVHGTASGSLARLNSDGTVDNTFNNGGSGPDNTVRKLFEERDTGTGLPTGKVYIVGTFGSYNGNASAPNGLMRLNSNGSLDATFNSGGSGTTSNAAVGNLEYSTATGLPTGKILMYSEVNIYNGTSTSTLYRVNADGTLDGTFTNSGLSSYVHVPFDMVPEYNTSGAATGKIYLGGFHYETYGAKPALIRVNANGTVDSGFGSGVNNFSNIWGGQIRSIVSEIGTNNLPTGNILVSGWFREYLGATVTPGFVRLTNTGAVDTSYKLATAGMGEMVYMSAQDYTGSSPNGKVMAVGKFIGYGGTPVSNGLAMLKANGDLDNSFNSSGAGINGIVNEVFSELNTSGVPTGKFLVGGGFDKYNGTTTPWIIRINADGTLDGTYNNLTTITNQNANEVIIILNELNTATGLPTGKLLVAGWIDVYGGVSFSRGLMRLNSDGSRDTGFSLAGTGLDDRISGMVSELSSATGLPTGKLVIAGGFSSYNGNGAFPDRLARLNSDGSWDTSFNNGGSGNSEGALTVAQEFNITGLPTGKFLFSSYWGGIYNGGSNGSRLKRINSDGTEDTGFNSGGSGPSQYGQVASIEAIVAERDTAGVPTGKFLIGGGMARYNGAVISNNIIRLNSNGSNDTTFNTGNFGSHGQVKTIAYEKGSNGTYTGRILIGGDITGYNLSPRMGISNIENTGLSDNYYPGNISVSPMTMPGSLTLLSPATTPNSDPTPTIRVSGGSIDLGSTVYIYTSSTCSLLSLRGFAASGATYADVTSNSLSTGTYAFYARVFDSSNNSSSCSVASVSYELLGLSVTVNQKVSQVDPTATLPVLFTVTFSESVTGLTTGDFTFSGNAVVSSSSLTGSGTTYELSIDALTENGSIIASLPANAAQNTYGGNSQASTSTDNTVTVTENIRRFSQISCAGGSCCGLTSAGQAYCWGPNDLGQVGDGTQTVRTSPVAVDMSPLTAGTSFISLANGADQTGGLTNDGKIYTWGSDNNGQIGNTGNTNPQLIPYPVSTANLNAGTSFVQLVHVYHGFCALANDGLAYCWGLGSAGALGDGATTNNNSPSAVTTTNLTAGSKFVKLFGGPSSSTVCGIANDGITYCWGQNNFGQIGNVSATSPQLIPIAVTTTNLTSGTQFVQISNGDMHTCGLANDGKAYCWGGSTVGQLGDNTNTARAIPTAIDATNLGSTQIVSIFSGGYTNFVIASDGKSYSWGADWNGELGDDTSTTEKWRPVLMNTAALTAGSTFKHIAQGYNSVCGLASDGKAYCWGQDTNGELGNGGAATNSRIPTAVDQSTIPINTGYIQLASGGGHNCGLRSDGKTFCWGDNTSGSIGNATTLEQTLPAKVKYTNLTAGTSFINLAQGGNGAHSCGIANDLKAYCWGRDNHGQLGDGGSNTNQSSPVLVDTTNLTAGSRFVQISVGADHTCGIASDGKAYCWGFDSGQQLGNGGGATDQNIPVAVTLTNLTAGSTFTQITAGEAHTCGIASDGKAYCWGSDTFGQVGNDTSFGNGPNIPGAVDLTNLSVGSGFVKISAGQFHTCGVTSSGGNFCWGRDENEQLGNGVGTTDLAIPAVINNANLVAGSSLKVITTSVGNGYGVASDGKSYSWGNDGYGQIGNGATTGTEPSPVLISLANLAAGNSFIDIVSSQYHVCGLANTGVAYCWGENNVGQLGNGGHTNSDSPGSVYSGETPPPTHATSLALFSPATSPGNDNTPTITVNGVNFGDTVKIYTDASCLVPALKGTQTSMSTSTNITSSTLSSDGSYTYKAEVIIPGGISSGCSTASVTYVLDTGPPNVTVNQKSGQADPTSALPILFTVTFSEPVSGLLATDFTVGGTATVTGKSLTGSGTTYELSVDTVTTSGTVTISLPVNAALDTASNNSQASTSTDNTVTYNMPTPANLSFNSPAEPVATYPNTADVTYTITNSGTQTATGMTFSGLATPFAQNGGTCGATLAGSTSCTYIVRFTSPGEVAAHDTIVLDYNNGVSAQQVTKGITGTGNAWSGASVVAVYSNGANWNDYIRNNGSNYYNADNTPCDGTETGFYNSCIHGAEKLKVVVTGVNSCTNLSITENLGAFDWECRVDGGVATFYTKRLSDGVSIRSLLNSTSWKNNSVTIYNGIYKAATSSSAAWWTNAVTPLPNNSLNTDTIQVLSTSGTIYTLDASRATSGYSIGADKIALVTLPDVVLSYSGQAANNCNAWSGSTATPDTRCVITVSNTRKFVWVTAFIDGYNVGNSTNIGINFSSSYSQIRDTNVNNSSGTGIEENLADNNIYRNVSASGNATYNIKVTGSYMHLSNIKTSGGTHGLYLNNVDNLVTYRVNSANQTYNGYFLGNSSDSISNIILATSSETGTAQVAGTKNNQAFITTSNSGNGGFATWNAIDSVFNNIFAVNHPTGTGPMGIGGDGTANNSRLFQIASFGFLSVGSTVTNTSFHENLLVNNTSDCFSINAGVNPGIVHNTCAQQGSSTHNLITGLNATNSFVGKASFDYMNASNSGGTQTFATISDWLNFDSFYRAWGLDGSAFPNVDHADKCSSGETCRIWDWRLKATDTQVRNKTGDGSTANEPFVAGATCPSVVHGNKVITDSMTVPHTYLVNAIEIIYDQIGNDNGLCESNEACIYAPNFGAYQGEGKLIGTCNFQNGTVTGVAMYAWSINGVGVSGALDTTFGTAGEQYLANAAQNNGDGFMALLPDGKVLGIGDGNNGTEGTFMISKVNANGGLDTSFNATGQVQFSLGTNITANPKAVVLQKDGKFIVGGRKETATTHELLLVRFNADGTTDTSFGTNGVVAIDSGFLFSRVFSLAIQDDGKILAGSAWGVSGGNVEASVHRFHPDGVLDSSFGTGGQKLISSANAVKGFAIQSDGNILLTGDDGTNSNMIVARLLKTNGAIDTSFNTTGVQTIAPITYGTSSGRSITIQPDGKILAVGVDENDDVAGQLFMARLNTNGSLDTTFNTTGKMSLNLAGFTYESLNSVKVQPDGRILLAGDEYQGTAGGNDKAFVIRLLSDGSFDSSFGAAGIATLWGDSTGASKIKSLEILPDGRIFVGGSKFGSDMSFLRLWP